MASENGSVRLFLTFMAAMNRPRDSARLWRNGVELWKQHPTLFEPAQASVNYAVRGPAQAAGGVRREPQSTNPTRKRGTESLGA